MHGRPPIANEGGELNAVHRSGHLDISKNQLDVCAKHQDGDSCIGIFGLQGDEAGVLDHVDRVQTEQRLVFDDKNRNIAHIYPLLTRADREQGPNSRQHHSFPERIRFTGRHLFVRRAEWALSGRFNPAPLPSVEQSQCRRDGNAVQ